MSSIESHLSNKPKQVFSNPIHIFDTFTHSITLLYIFNKLFSFNVNFFEQNDATHNEVHQKLGESYYDHQKWSKAAKCFEQVKAGSGCTEKLIDCYFKSEQWQQMIDLGKYSKRRSEHRVMEAL